MATREEKKQARIQRYQQHALNAEKASEQAFTRSQKLVENIPAGQPIQAGRRGIAHRNTLDKSWNALGISVKLEEKAEYYRRKAEAAENNDAIYTEDEDAEERLTAKIENLEKSHAAMKLINKIARNTKLSDDDKVKQIIALGYTEESTKEIVKKCGFAWYVLPYNLAEIKRLKQRLQIVKRNKTATDLTFICGDIEVKTNYKENRLQVFFPDKPSYEIRTQLKRRAFRWSPSNECWQSFLNRWQLDKVKDILSEFYPDREFKQQTAKIEAQ